VLHQLGVYVSVILKPPTASWYFWGSGAGRLAVCQGCGSSVEYLARKARLAGLANLRAQCHTKINCYVHNLVQKNFPWYPPSHRLSSI